MENNEKVDDKMSFEDRLARALTLDLQASISLLSIILSDKSVYDAVFNALCEMQKKVDEEKAVVNGVE